MDNVIVNYHVVTIIDCHYIGAVMVYFYEVTIIDWTSLCKGADLGYCHDVETISSHYVRKLLWVIAQMAQPLTVIM